MKFTKNLKLPVYNEPERDMFDLTLWNDANENIDKAYEETIVAKDRLEDMFEEIPKVNANAEVVDARNGETTLGNKIRSIDSQLDDLANKGTTVEVLERVTKEEIDRQITDGTIANLTIADDSITNTKLKNKSVDYNNTTFINAKRINLIDLTKLTRGVLNSNGTINGEMGHVASVTDFIEVEVGSIYTTSSVIRATPMCTPCGYDKNKTFATTLSWNVNSLTIPSGVKYIRLYISTTSTNNIDKMLVLGDKYPNVYIPYENLDLSLEDAYKKCIKNNVFEEQCINIEHLNDNLFMIPKKEIFIPKTTEAFETFKFQFNTEGLNLNQDTPITIKFKYTTTETIPLTPVTLFKFGYGHSNNPNMHFIDVTNYQYYINEKDILQGKEYTFELDLKWLASDLRKWLRCVIYMYKDKESSIKFTLSDITLLVDGMTIKNDDMYYTPNKTDGYYIKDILDDVQKGKGQLATYTYVNENIKSLQKQISSGSGALNGMKWNVIGDSITYPADAYHKWIAEETGLVVNNYGVAGDTLANILSRIDDMDIGAELITIFGGTNDFGKNIQLETTREVMKQICEKIIKKHLGKRIGIILPIQRADIEVNALNKTLLDYCNAIKEVAEYYSIPVLDMNRSGGFPVNIAEFCTAYVSTDKLHPNTNGQKIMSRRIKSFISSL